MGVLQTGLPYTFSSRTPQERAIISLCKKESQGDLKNHQGQNMLSSYFFLLIFSLLSL